MGRIIFVNRFFFPDQSATSQLLSDLAFEFAARGQQVAVISSRSGYEPGTAPLPRDETVQGVAVHRTGSTRFGRDRALGRLADYLTFYVTGMWRLLWLTRRGDVVVAMTDPPMLNVATLIVARLRGARNVSWFQDVFPEVAQIAGAGTRYRFATGTGGIVLGMIAGWANRRSDASVVLGERMHARMLQHRVRPERLRLISNWSDLERVHRVRHADNPLRRQWAPDDEFIVGYSGNMGVAHDLRPLLAAAERLLDCPTIRFVFIGQGKQRAGLEAQVRERKLRNVTFHPYQPRDQLHLSLGAIDLHAVSLRPSMEGLIVPSKFFGVAAAGRPTLFLGDPDGEVAQLIRKYQCGIAVDAGDVDGLVRVIRQLAGDPDLCDQMGTAAREMAEREFSLSRTVELWNGLLADLDLSAGPTTRMVPPPVERAGAPERH